MRFTVTVNIGLSDADGAIIARRHTFTNLGEWSRFWAARVADGTACRCYMQDPEQPHYDRLLRSTMA